MAHFSVVPLVATILLFANFALASSAIETYDIRDLAENEIILTEDDIVSGLQLTDGLFTKERALRFIGDVEAGARRVGDTVFTRQITVSNPTNVVYSTDLVFSVTNGIIHYISLVNEPGSYVVACTSALSLGSSRSTFNLRVAPQTKYLINLVVAAH